MSDLVLSIFPGMGLLDRAFEEEGFTVVRGPDLLWGGNIKLFHPPAGRFDGIIGGPPCQVFSQMIHIIRHMGYREGENLIPEFERVVAEAQPGWFVMENVEPAPLPCIEGYALDPSLFNNRWIGGEESRLHRFTFGSRDGRRLDYSPDVTVFENWRWAPRVMASGMTVLNSREAEAKRDKQHRLKQQGYVTREGLRRSCELQGLPRDFFDHSPFTVKEAVRMVGNAVPLPMGLALARAVKCALMQK